MKKYALKNNLNKEHRGWVDVVVDGLPQKLCYNTTVKLLERNKKREVVEILDGWLAGRIAYLAYMQKRGNEFISYLDEDLKSSNKLVIKYDKFKSVLIFPSFRLNTLYCDFPAGIYNILIPRYPHSKSGRYITEEDGGSRFAETWFQVESKERNVGARFIHFGRISEGCITVIGPGGHWNKMYLFLMNNRVDHRRVAILEVE